MNDLNIIITAIAIASLGCMGPETRKFIHKLGFLMTISTGKYSRMTTPFIKTFQSRKLVTNWWKFVKFKKVHEF